MKVFIDPPNSMVLFDLVERFGHEPLSSMAVIQEKVDNIEVDMPPMNVTLDDVVKGLKYAQVVDVTIVIEVKVGDNVRL